MISIKSTTNTISNLTKNQQLKNKSRCYNNLKWYELMIYLNRHLNRYCKKNRNKLDRRPKELKILHIAKATRLSYKQVRTRIDELVRTGVLLRYRAYSSLKKHGNFYRFNTSK